jgi:hypothetical protein
VTDRETFGCDLGIAAASARRPLPLVPDYVKDALDATLHAKHDTGRKAHEDAIGAGEGGSGGGALVEHVDSEDQSTTSRTFVTNASQHLSSIFLQQSPSRVSIACDQVSETSSPRAVGPCALPGVPGAGGAEEGGGSEVGGGSRSKGNEEGGHRELQTAAQPARTERIASSPTSRNARAEASLHTSGGTPETEALPSQRKTFVTCLPDSLTAPP